MKKSLQFTIMLFVSVGTFIGYAPSLAEQWQTQGLPEQGIVVVNGLATSLPWNEEWKNWKNYLQKTEALFYAQAKIVNANKSKENLIESNKPIQPKPMAMENIPVKPTTTKETAPILPNTKIKTAVDKTNNNKSEANVVIAVPPAGDTPTPILTNPPPSRILIVGDSMAGSLGFGLKHFLKNTPIINKHRHSTGLTFKNYYDWPEQLKKIEEEAEADFIISMLGTNDAQSISYQNKIYSMQSLEWDNAYAERAREWKQALDSTGKPYIVVGMPKMRDDYFDKRMQRINAIMEPIFGERFLKISDKLLDSVGNYDASLRASDGIHFAGGAINKVTELILQKEKWNIPITNTRPSRTKTQAGD